MSKAELLLRERGTDENGNLYELAVWKVDIDRRHPQGVRYRLAFLRAGDRTPVVLYDNHHPKGHHRHLHGREERYQFSSVESLIEDFLREVRAVLESRR